jgi:hypothetical protein
MTLSRDLGSANFSASEMLIFKLFRSRLQGLLLLCRRCLLGCITARPASKVILHRVGYRNASLVLYLVTIQNSSTPPIYRGSQVIRPDYIPLYVLRHSYSLSFSAVSSPPPTLSFSPHPHDEMPAPSHPSKDVLRNNK